MEIRRLTGDEAHAFGPQFVALMAETFDADAAARKRDAWDWLFDTPLASEGPQTEVLAIYEGESPVGAILMLPMRIAYQGQLGVWRQPMALMMKPDKRGGGIALIRRVFSTYDKVLGIPGDDRLERIYIRLGKMIGTGVVNNFRPLRPGRIAARRKGLGAIGHILAWPVDLAWQSGVRLRRVAASGMKEYEIEEITDFGPEFDHLWQTTYDTYPIVHQRDAAQLNWRYRDFPLGCYRSFLLRVAGQPAGYVITRLEEGEGRRNLQIADIFCASGTTDIYRALLAQAETAALDARADQIVLETTAHCWASDVIRRAGYHFRKPMPDLMVGFSDPSMRAHLPEVINGYHYCRGDGDEDY